MEHVELPKVRMRGNPVLSERWVQGVLAADPSLLGLGELDMREAERRQPHGGRLDMLLEDTDTSTRYEVELQLGGTDESHIIRTLEYWDTERRRYPQYDHIAVIVAEEITSRFFNVISLFNGFIPIVAIQMTALRVSEDQVALVFTKVLDHAVLGTDEEDRAEPTDRGHWDKRSAPEIMKLVDRLHSMVEQHDSGVELKYNKHYIGLVKNGTATTYVSMIPQKKKMNVSFRIPRSDEVTDMIDESGIGTLPYDKWFSHYRVTIPHATDIDNHSQLLTDLINIAKPR